MAEDFVAVLCLEAMLSDRFVSNLHQIVNSRVNTSANSILSNVKDSFDSFKFKAAAYIQASVVAASFVCETTVIKDVKFDVENNQSTEKLLSFTNDMIRHLKKCESCLFELENVEKELNAHLSNAIKQAEEKHRARAVAETCSKKEPQQSGSVLAGKALLGVGAMALGALAMLTGGSVFIAFATIAASSAMPVALSATVGTVAGVTVSVTASVSHIAMVGAGAAVLGAGAVVKGGIAVAEGVGAAATGVGTVAIGIWSSLFSAETIGEEQVRLLEEAKRQILQIIEDHCKAKIDIQKIQVYLTKVKNYIEGEGVKGLREEAQNPCYRESSDGLLVLRKIFVILTNLDGLKECMEKVLILTKKYAM